MLVTVDEYRLEQAAAMKEAGKGGLQEHVRRLVSGYRSLEAPDTLFYHAWDSRNSTRGWPDCTIVLPSQGRVIFSELKGPKGRPTWDQVEFLDAFALLGFEVYLWRPIHLVDGTIERVLRGGPLPVTQRHLHGGWLEDIGVPGDKYSWPRTRKEQQR